ncbi:hypothetical protein PG999_004756 [Apiospora kogelbergensis]|uniref:Uncharacterized protein n=1 Tax=Apiospora kogelbergensis TaxID=1337665 RepID=A0AAW0R073_9PEZI
MGVGLTGVGFCLHVAFWVRGVQSRVDEIKKILAPAPGKEGCQGEVDLEKGNACHLAVDGQESAAGRAMSETAGKGGWVVRNAEEVSCAGEQDTQLHGQRYHKFRGLSEP